MPKIQTSSDRTVEVTYSRSGVLYLSISTADGQSISTRMSVDVGDDLVEILVDALEAAEREIVARETA